MLILLEKIISPNELMEILQDLRACPPGTTKRFPVQRPIPICPTTDSLTFLREPWIWATLMTSKPYLSIYSPVLQQYREIEVAWIEWVTSADANVRSYASRREPATGEGWRNIPISLNTHIVRAMNEEREHHIEIRGFQVIPRGRVDVIWDPFLRRTVAVASEPMQPMPKEPEPITQAKIDRVFGLNEEYEKKWTNPHQASSDLPRKAFTDLQRAIEKAKRHL